MARYRAKSYLFIGGSYITPGTRFESKLVPGKNWEPLDDDAREAVGKREAEVARQRPEVIGVSRPDGTLRLSAFDRMQPAATEIPADWSSLSQSKRRALAMKLGAPRQIKVPDADAMIEREVARRATAAA